MNVFADGVIDFYRNLDYKWKLPDGFKLIYPFDQDEVWHVFTSFYSEFFRDHHKRVLLFGINPGRFGAGVTGIPFTDPSALETYCKIPNSFNKRQELSSIFVYEFIEAFGGVKKFYKHFMITSVCPLGFIKDGININYYDDPKLLEAVEAYIVTSIEKHIAIGAYKKAAICIGQGQNYKFLKSLNEKHGFFENLIAMPHPRWVMQYKRKTKEDYIQKYVDTLNELIV